MSTPNVIPVSSETIEVREHDKWVLQRVRIFAPATDLIYLMRFLRESKCTGTLFVDMNQGSIGMLRFREEMSVEPNGK